MSRFTFKMMIAGVAMASMAIVAGCSSSGGSGSGSPSSPQATSSGSSGSSAPSASAQGGDLGNFAGKTINVVAAWSGDEQKNFEKVLKNFEDKTGAKITYESFGDNGPTFIQGRLEGGNPPNVAIVGQPALMQKLATDKSIMPLPQDVADEVAKNYSQSWVDLSTVGGKNYGVWFKAANKSTVWYNKKIWDEAGADPAKATDWAGFMQQLQLLTDAGYAGVSVGADVGWPLTDWFENAYLRIAGADKYDQLTKHEIPWTDPSVKQTLDELAKLFGSDLVEQGGAQRDFPTSVTEVFGAKPKAGTVYEGDFVAGNIASDGNSKVGDNALFFDFPSINGSKPAVMGGGDVAVAFTDDDATAALMKYLASPESASIWVPLGGLTSPNNKVDLALYPDDVSRQIAESLTKADTFRFDMSDLTPSAFGGTQGKGFWQEMIKFYSNPTDVQGTMTRLEAAAKAAYK